MGCHANESLSVERFQVWNGYDGFWQDGCVLETFTNFIAFTNKTHTRYKHVITSSERDLYSLLEAYAPYPTFDDMAWYGLSYSRIHEVLGAENFLQDAEDIYDWIWNKAWDTNGTCGGGLWFSSTYTSKQTITNAQMILLSGRLYRLTGKKKYHDKMFMVYNFVFNNSLIDDMTYLVSDGATENCTAAEEYGPTYNSGVMIGALVELYKVTKKSEYLDVAHKLAFAEIQHSSNADGIFVEGCAPYCDDDALMFKGIFARNIRFLLDELGESYSYEKDYLRSWLSLQIQNNLEKNMCDIEPISKCNISFKDGPPFYNMSGPVFSYDWRGPFHYGAPMQQTGVLELFLAAMQPETECRGKLCDYDPYFPPPNYESCNDKPCYDSVCCEISVYYPYTCCDTGQKCNKTTGTCH